MNSKYDNMILIFKVMESWLNSGAANNILALDISTCDALSEGVLTMFMNRNGTQLQGYR